MHHMQLMHHMNMQRVPAPPDLYTSTPSHLQTFIHHSTQT